jgi:hypothetical protein
MKISTKQVVRWFLLTLVIVLMFDLAWSALAQTNVSGSGTNAPPNTGSGGGVLSIFSQLSGWEFLLIPFCTVLIQAVRKFVPQIPSNVWPWVAPFIGAILDYLGSKVGIWTGNVAVGAMFGGLATWFQQLDKQSVGFLDRILPPASSQPPSPSGGNSQASG